MHATDELPRSGCTTEDEYDLDCDYSDLDDGNGVVARATVFSDQRSDPLGGVVLPNSDQRDSAAQKGIAAIHQFNLQVLRMVRRDIRRVCRSGWTRGAKVDVRKPSNTKLCLYQILRLLTCRRVYHEIITRIDTVQVQPEEEVEEKVEEEDEKESRSTDDEDWFCYLELDAEALSPVDIDMDEIDDFLNEAEDFK
jgi:hypothetical protein